MDSDNAPDRSATRRRCALLCGGILLLACAAVYVHQRHVWTPARSPLPMRSSLLPGQVYTAEVLSSVNPRLHLQLFRMQKAHFIELVGLLSAKGLRSTRISSEEKLFIFLALSAGRSYRMTEDRFQHSGDTISHVFHEVLDALVLFSMDEGVITPPSVRTCFPDRLRKNPRFFPFFENCIGAIDGSHFPVHVPIVNQGPFRNRKGQLSTNVLVSSTLDNTMFQMIYPGWEGSAADSRVFAAALELGDLPTIQGKFYLADAGFPLRPYCLVPFRKVRYHLKEWGRAGCRPENKEELYNLRHAQIRNVVEKILGIFKGRFPILLSPRGFDFESTTVPLFRALAALHNFIWMRNSQRVNTEEDTLFMNMFHEVLARTPAMEDAGNRAPLQNDRHGVGNERVDGARLRDEIATAMWEAYSARRDGPHDERCITAALQGQ